MSETETATKFALFPTSIGSCGVAWRGNEIVATQLPESTDETTRTRLVNRARARFEFEQVECEPTPVIVRAIAAMTALLDGVHVDLRFVACDFRAVDAFDARVYDITRDIPPGETWTYGEIAVRLGDKLFAQAVGRALGRNPVPIIVPCHRVLGAGGKLTGFSANGGVATKLRMLAIERADLGKPAGLFDDLPLAVKPPRKSRNAAKGVD
jgi:methylated-DNA-[protein]-cysteine S-methyltransferase